MRPSPLLSLLALAAGGPRVAPGPAPQSAAPESARLELALERSSPVVQEWIPLRLRLAVESELLEGGLVDSFPRRLDLQLQLAIPWLQPRPDLRARQAGVTGGLSLVVNDGLGSALPVGEEQRDGRSWRLLELAYELQPLAAGRLELEPTSLRFAYATRFADDFLNGRRPLDRVECRLEGAAGSLEVRPLPDPPAGLAFGGAVGRFELEASLASATLAVGETLEIVAELSGPGNYGAFQLEPPSGLEGFHALGVLRTPTEHGERTTFELRAERSGEQTLPPLRLAYYDPGPPEGYRTLETAAFVVHVSGVGGPQDDSEPGGAPAQESAQAAERKARPWLSSDFLTGLIVGGGLAGLLALLTQLRRRRSSAQAPRPAAGGIAPAHSAAERRAPAHGSAAELAGLLATRLGCPEPAVVDARLAERLIAVGLSEELAREAQGLLEALYANEYAPSEREGAEPGLRERLARLRPLLEDPPARGIGRRAGG